MNRALSIVCLVGVIFTVGALADDTVVGAELAAPATIEPEQPSAAAVEPETPAPVAVESTTPAPVAVEPETSAPETPAPAVNEAEKALAAANEKILAAVQAALAEDFKAFIGIASRHKFDSRYGTDIERQWHPAIDHMIRSIEYTRREIITEALENSKGSATLKHDVIDAHHRAYAAVDMKMMELAKALVAIKDHHHEANAVESILKMGIKQAKSL